MSDICEWFTEYIDLAEDVVIIKFSDGTTKTVKRGIYLKEVEDNIRKMLIDQVKDRPTGHWINAKVGKLFPSNDFKCSECGNVLNFDGVNCGRGDANYCPNCGAKMKEGD